MRIHQSYQTVLSRSSTLPVSLTDLKAQLPVVGSQDDSRLTALEWAAVDFIERQLDRYLVTTTVREVFDRFPALWDYDQGYFQGTFNPWPFSNFPNGITWDWARWQRMELSRSPVQSITSFTYFDANNVVQTLVENTDYYFISPTDRPAFVQPINVWPVAMYRPGAVQLVYVAGYSTCPYGLQQAVKLLVGHWNEHREAQVDGQVTEIEFAVRALINSYSNGVYV